MRAVALYVGALLGPGLLFIPALADQTAGPASIVAWMGLLLLSVPLAITFGALGIRYPVADGVSAYARAAFGESASRVTGVWFLTAVVLGAPAVALIGGYYVADLVGGGSQVAVAAALAMYVVVLGANAAGLRWSSGAQLVLSFALVALVATAIAVAIPPRIGHHWSPFAPHGWWAVGSAAAILVWLFVGWEAMAQLAGDLPNPSRDLPRAIARTFALVTLLYVGIAVATIVVTGGRDTRVPLAALIGAAFGHTGRILTAVVAVALTAGTMNVYVAAGAKLAGALAVQASLPRWLAGERGRTIPRAPLALLTLTGAALLIALKTGITTPAQLVRATSACFVAVYFLALAAATRLLRGPLRVAAATAVTLTCVVAAFSAAYLLVPGAAALATLAAGSRRSAAVDPVSAMRGDPT